MNKAQKVVLGVGIGAIALMGLFPPWNLTFAVRGLHSTTPAGYALISEPPALSPDKDARFYTVSIDIPRLLIQWAIVAAVTGGLVLLISNRPSGTGGNDSIRPDGQALRRESPTQPGVGSANVVKRTQAQPTLADAPYIGPTVFSPSKKLVAAEATRSVPAEKPESLAPAYPPIWSHAHTLPASATASISDSESERWPWPRVALWIYNWCTWLAFVGAFAILANVSALSEFKTSGANAPQCSESAVALSWLRLAWSIGFTVAIVYAYAKLFKDPNRAARVLLCAYMASAVLGVIAITCGLFGELGWAASVCGVLMACLCRPLIRPRFVQLAHLLDSLHRQGVPHSFMPKYGRCVPGSREQRERFSLWRLYRQVVTGKIILPHTAG